MSDVSTLLWFWLALAATHLADLPAFPVGAELRIVSPDLLTVYSSGRVADDHLSIDLPLDGGTEVRLLVFPPDATDEEVAEALSGGAALFGTVAEDRADIYLRVEDLTEPLSLRAWLQQEHGITLVMITRSTR